MEENDKIVKIDNEESLPIGDIISYVGDVFELPEKSRKEILVWDISQEDKKLVWILSLKTAFHNNYYLQLIKDIEKSNYRIVKKCIADSSVINSLYERRINLENQKETSENSIVVASFELMLKDALKEGVSDVHIEVRKQSGIIRMRKNGEMMDYNVNKKYSYNEANDMCSVIYNILASTKDVSFNPREYQQATVDYTLGGEDLKLRYQSLPAYPDGYDVVLRVLPIGKVEEFTPLQNLGYEEQQVEEILEITSKPNGAFVISGITGSGKSTTLKNLLMYINANTSYKLKIYSIEDPPEYTIAKITQVPVVIGKNTNLKINSAFEAPIKACMRGDPDILMIGEVRDGSTGDLIKKAIQSGHQVLTTTHTNSAVGIVERFQDFGLNSNVLCSPDFFSGLLYQKLLPVLCNHCNIDLNEIVDNGSANQEEVEIYSRINEKINGQISKYKIKIRKHDGCPHCKGSGITDRTVCAEVISVDLNMLQYISDNNIIGLIRYWRGLSDKDLTSNNMRGKTAMEHGFYKVLQGIVSPFDLESSFASIKKINYTNKEVKKEKEDWENI